MMYSNCYFDLHFWFVDCLLKILTVQLFLSLLVTLELSALILDFILDFCIFDENDIFFFSTVTDSSVNFLALFLSFSCFLLSQSVFSLSYCPF